MWKKLNERRAVERVYYSRGVMTSSSRVSFAILLLLLSSSLFAGYNKCQQVCTDFMCYLWFYIYEANVHISSSVVFMCDTFFSPNQGNSSTTWVSVSSLHDLKRLFYICVSFLKQIIIVLGYKLHVFVQLLRLKITITRGQSNAVNVT